LAPMAETVCSMSAAKCGSVVANSVNFPRRNVHYRKGHCNSGGARCGPRGEVS
jgi:hypothetical protein